MDTLLRTLGCAHATAREGDEPVSHHLAGMPATEEDRWRIIQARRLDQSLHTRHWCEPSESCTARVRLRANRKGLELYWPARRSSGARSAHARICSHKGTEWEGGAGLVSLHIVFSGWQSNKDPWRYCWLLGAKSLQAAAEALLSLSPNVCLNLGAQSKFCWLKPRYPLRRARRRPPGIARQRRSGDSAHAPRGCRNGLVLKTTEIPAPVCFVQR